MWLMLGVYKAKQKMKKEICMIFGDWSNYMAMSQEDRF